MIYLFMDALDLTMMIILNTEQTPNTKIQKKQLLDMLIFKLYKFSYLETIR